ncbi:MAG: xanthine dehydrogenase family protein molybdopterin-binding subunit [Deltaproteobacteria bacterium]|nr:xanthine dehydrogenase family protein molybdopterin-binding subunit [Deltaproteobacteria bacterium]
MDPKRLDYIGRSLERVDARQKITGSGIFTADHELPGMLFAKIARSPHPHAKIRAVNLKPALGMRGVRAAISALDLPDVRFGSGVFDKRLLARGVVRHAGEPVAAVAAESLTIAEEAIRRIEIDYEPLPAVFDPEEAMDPKQKILVHPHLSDYQRAAAWTPDFLGRPNISNYFAIKRGDLKAGFQQADFVIENTFEIAPIQHVPMEPHCAVSRAEPDGGLTVWSPARVPNHVASMIPLTLKVPPHKLQIITLEIGGTFGGKSDGQVEGICAALALRSKRPVRIVLGREEEFLTVTKHAFRVKIKDGVKQDGTVVARQVEVILNGGAYSTGFSVTRNCTFGIANSYKIPHVSVEAYRVYTHLPAGGAFRGFGITDVVWAIEQQTDIIAERLGLDRVEYRMRQMLRQGDTNILGERMDSFGSVECLTAVSQAIGWPNVKREAQKGSWKKGVGIAWGQKYSTAPTSATSEARIHSDGTVSIYVGAIEQGQGLRSAMAQIAAEELKTPVDKIHVYTGERGRWVHDGGAISSRQTFNTGNAVWMAVRDLKARILNAASSELRNKKTEELDYLDGKIFVKGQDEPVLKLSDLFGGGSYYGPYRGPIEYLHTNRKGEEFIGRGTWSVRSIPLDPTTGVPLVEGLATAGSQLIFDASATPAAWTADAEKGASRTGKGAEAPNIRVNAFYTPAAAVAEVEVNVETGEVRVLRLVCAADGGKIINPLLAEGQVEGAACMAVGMTLMEGMQYKAGCLINGNFKDYKIPAAPDMPFVDSFRALWVESPHKEGPFSAKGLAEVAIVPVPAALANAVYDAVGVRVKELPITAEKIYLALRKKESGRS